MIVTKKSHYPSLIKNQSGEDIQELLGVQAGSVYSHSLAEITIPPGKSSTPHYHKETEETYLILSGLASMVIDKEQLELEVGEAVLIEPMEIHQISNQGNDNLIFLAVCVPAWQAGDSFEASSGLFG